MGLRIPGSVLLGTLFFFVPPAQAQVSEAEAHVLSAFTTSADPGVLADNVGVGPELRAHVGPDPELHELYQAIASLTAGRPLRVQIAPPAEAARYRGIAGVNPTDPLVTLEAGEQRFLFQYVPKQKRVRFVEQLGGEALPRLAQRKRPKPAGPPAALAVVRPRTPSTSFDGPITIEPGTPRGECVIKPIMTAMDLYNCSGPTAPAPPATDLPPPVPLAAPKPQPVPEAPRGECVIKPVMSDEDLRNCAGVTASTPPVFPAQAAGTTVAPARPECMIKPVMTDEEMRLCAAVSRSTPSTPPPAAAAPVAVQTPEPPAARKAPAECVIKPVMTDEDLRICAALAKSTPSVPPVPAVSYQDPAAAAPSPLVAPARRECVIKPVMSDEDLRACANVSTSVAPIPSAPAPTAQTPPAPSAPRQRPECVIKPVMTDEELRACGSRR